MSPSRILPVISLIAAAYFTFASVVYSQALLGPEYISHQGLLTDTSGVAENGMFDMTFTLYSGATKVWEETHEDVQVVNGLFEVQLGSVMAFDTLTFGHPYNLGIKVGTDPEMAPRTLLTFAPHALNVRGIRIEPNNINKDSAPSIIAGDYRNRRRDDAEAIVIAGGGGIEDVGDAGFENLFHYADHSYATISGGLGNTAGQYSTVSGGVKNLADDFYTTVGGGKNNTASDFYATVPGGYKNMATGWSSFAAGQGAEAIHDASFVWHSTTASNETFASTGSRQFLVQASGGVGIGTNAPSNQLSVNGKSDFTDSVGVGTTTPSALLHVRTENRQESPAAQSSDDIVISSIDAVFGGYSPNIGAWGSGLVLGEVDGSDLVNKWTIVREAGAGADLHFKFGTTANYAGHATRFEIRDEDGLVRFFGNAVPNATNSLDLGTSSTSWRDLYLQNEPSITSDERLKTDISDLEYGLDDVLRLRPITYRWREGGPNSVANSPDGDRHIGLIAQETAAVVPEVVHEPGDMGDGNLSIRYGELIPVLIKAVQQQQERIEQLEALVAAATGPTSSSTAARRPGP